MKVYVGAGRGGEKVGEGLKALSNIAEILVKGRGVPLGELER
jgi:hypothetical protein